MQPIIKPSSGERDPVILTNNGKPDAVLINFDEYAEFEKAAFPAD